jgi:hypothetical protein
MNIAHPEHEALESYVVGLHDGLVVDEIESHLRGCPHCLEVVRREARLELALSELAADNRFCPGCLALMAADRCERCGAIAQVNGLYIQQVLVQNAHGRMYLARLDDGQAVALKELAFVQPPHPDAVAAFEREGRLLRQLSHAQIPRFLGSFAHGQGVHTRLYLAQEYVAGESLLARLERHQFDEAEAREICRQVLDILIYLQSLSPPVFHRDIKPANLIRRPDGRISLVDFGAARDMGATAGATLVGTFGYMPVEQLGGLVDATTDLYALGATLAHLLSRREPWKFLEEPRSLERLNVSPAFRAFLGKLMGRRPADRFPSAVAAATALATLDQRRWLPRRLPSRRLLMVGASLAFMGMGAALFSRSRRRRGARRRDPVMLAPGEASAQLAIDPSESYYKPRLPEGTRPGIQVWALVKVCASADGDVTSAKIIKSADYLDMDREIVDKVMRWRYRPYLRDGAPVPFCATVRLEIRTQP